MIGIQRELPTDIGERQQFIQDERFLYLNIALSKQYTLSAGSSTSLDLPYNRTILFPNHDLEPIREFRPYCIRDPFAASLTTTTPISATTTPPNSPPTGAVIPPRSDSIIKRLNGGNLDPIIAQADVKLELQRLENDERYREGGILYLVGHQNLFWTMILCWHRSGTTGHRGWDFVMSRISKNDSDKSQADCMFFCTPFGCHIKNCQYLHSLPRKEACEKFTRQKSLTRHVAKLETLIEECEEVDDIVDIVAEELEVEMRERIERQVSTSSKGSDDEFCGHFEEDSDSVVRKNRSGRLSAASMAFEAAEIVAAVSREPRKVYCKTCGKQEPVGQKYKLCSRCRKVRYCGRTCQEQDWKKGHMNTCHATKLHRKHRDISRQ
ncbi:hypothetical protein HK098_006717 [Nowakowskiella sp. JEL0407]|nr:hypothetical protein HK098_006717 [Nowakowskiella sp. JEL0407]